WIGHRPALRRLRAFEARKAKQLAFRPLRGPLLTPQGEKRERTSRRLNLTMMMSELSQRDNPAI
ncbi:hypothetical protein, partial [Mesorhizobium sp.]|uniref:hypothetical protein n=1 Tax=Mesorhizobium sp. TaxID=1871066 RepID=UPI0025C4C9C8